MPRLYEEQAQSIAATILAGFNKHYSMFRNASSGAKTLFEEGNWHGIQQLVADRIRMYDDRVRESVEVLRRELAANALNDDVWAQAKKDYIALLVNHKQPELAETFFNSVSTKILDKEYYNNQFIFVKPAISTEYIDSEPRTFQSFYPFVPEGKSLNTLLKEFREQRNHMAVVVDEYGGISGLVTFEDIIEQILGDIEDEFDEDDDADNIFAVSEERWRIKAVTEIEDINEFFGTRYSDEEVDTIGGLVIQELGHLPVRGEKVTLGPLQFTVARADHRRLHTLMAVRVKAE